MFSVLDHFELNILTINMYQNIINVFKINMYTKNELVSESTLQGRPQGV